MIGYVTLGTKDIEPSAKFYDQLLAEIGGKRFMEMDTFIAWSASPTGAALSVTKPFDGNAATVGNGVMVALRMDSTDKVDALYRKAIELGVRTRVHRARAWRDSTPAISATPTATSSTHFSWDSPEIDRVRRRRRSDAPRCRAARGEFLTMRVPAEEFRALDLEVHAFLADVPLRDVSAIDLPGGGEGRSIPDVRALRDRDAAVTAPLPVRVLFAIRLRLGRLLGWDRAVDAYAGESYIQHLSHDQRARSVEEPGSADGPFQLLYQFPGEVLGETRNATVHAFSCMALCRTSDDYRLYWGIYVKNVSRFTPL